MSGEEDSNYELFKEAVSQRLIQKLAPVPVKPSTGRSKRRQKRQISRQGDATDLASSREVSSAVHSDGENAGDEAGDNDNEGDDRLEEFVEYLASDIFAQLPEDLRTVDRAAMQTGGQLSVKYGDPISDWVMEQLASAVPGSATETLSSYSIVADGGTIIQFLRPVVAYYVAAASAPPPVWIRSREGVSSCEICDRDSVRLSYHHLIPRSTHEKAVKRGWHAADRLNSVAWLCRSCHNMVHRVATNDGLARHYYTVDSLLGREDVQKWARWRSKCAAGR